MNGLWYEVTYLIGCPALLFAIALYALVDGLMRRRREQPDPPEPELTPYERGLRDAGVIVLGATFENENGKEE